MDLKTIYNISDIDILYCNILKKLHRSKRKVFRRVKEYSKKKYGRKNNLLRYYYHKCFNIPIGKFSYGFKTFRKHDPIESIGAFSSIASGVQITGGNHPIECITGSPIVCLKEFGFVAEDNIRLIDRHISGKVTIGNDVWIGQDVIILRGVKIGNGAVIGAGAVVTKDVPDYAIVVGVPAKIMRYRFEPEEIAALNRIKWWDWPDEKIKANIDLMYNPKEFIAKFDPIKKAENDQEAKRA